MLNRLWLGFFLTAALAALARWLIGGDSGVFAAMVGSLFDMAKLSVEVMILLFGTLTLWLGLLRIAERAGLIDALARLLGPLFRRLMPEVPAGHPAVGLITLNFAANALGLDNAATPIGLRAMRELQTLNPSADTASNAQILFLVLNASSLTLLPVSIFMYRAQQGAHDPTLVFLPILLATSASTLTGFLAVAFVQKLKLRDPVVLLWLVATAVLLGGFIALLAILPAAALAPLSSLLGNLTLFAIVIAFLVVGAWRKVPVYESFVDGAKQGFEVARDLLPYLVAMLCAVGVLRASGALDFALDGIRWLAGIGRFRHALRRRAADRAGQAVLRQRRARDADRDDEDARRRQLPGARRGDRAGQYRDDVLRARGVLRRGRHQARAPRGRLRAAGRSCGRDRVHRGLLLVLRLTAISCAAPGVSPDDGFRPFPRDFCARRRGAPGRVKIPPEYVICICNYLME